VGTSGELDRQLAARIYRVVSPQVAGEAGGGWCLVEAVEALAPGGRAITLPVVRLAAEQVAEVTGRLRDMYTARLLLA
jgi:hypothetical protein